MSDKNVDKRCAMGLPGYDMVSGQSYVPRTGCMKPRTLGHIFCHECREASGGFVRWRVESPARAIA